MLEAIYADQISPCYNGGHNGGRISGTSSSNERSHCTVMAPAMVAATTRFERGDISRASKNFLPPHVPNRRPGEWDESRELAKDRYAE
jgi:hypothetical protein